MCVHSRASRPRPPRRVHLHPQLWIKHPQDRPRANQAHRWATTPALGPTANAAQESVGLLTLRLNRTMNRMPNRRPNRRPNRKGHSGTSRRQYRVVPARPHPPRQCTHPTNRCAQLKETLTLRTISSHIRTNKCTFRYTQQTDNATPHSTLRKCEHARRHRTVTHYTATA
jgi:hypothetical protein